MKLWPAIMVALGLSSIGPAVAGPVAEDPVGSANWPDIRDQYLAPGELVFDDGLHVLMPDKVEDSHDVPVVVKIPSDLGQLREFVLLVEDNPIQAVTRMRPHRLIESVGLNIRLEMSTAVRAAALDEAGIWHVGSKEVLVLSPGGCSTPNPVAGDVSIGDIAIKQFERVGGASRTKVRIAHPMDTGFAQTEAGDAIPAYYIDRVEIADESGPVVEMETWAAMASDPTIILDLPESKQSLVVRARDSKGLEFDAFEPPATM
jgi:sulfur-oxidizing protein SoxY